MKPQTIGIFSVSKEQDRSILQNPHFLQLQHFLKTHNIQLYIPDDLLLPIEGVSPKLRAEQLHKLYTDNNIDILWALTGGSASNEILEYLNFTLIQKSHKPMMGFSDVFVLLNAITQQTRIINYLAPNIKTLIKGFPGSETSLEILLHFLHNKKNFLMNFESTFDVSIQQERKNSLKILQHGKAEAVAFGGNLSSITLLVDTPFFPDLENTILLLEECDEFSIGIIRRNLFRLRYSKNFAKIAGVIFGHINQVCYKDYNFHLEQTILDVFGDLSIPIIINAGLGHILPVQVFPIGGKYILDTENLIFGQFTLGN